LNEFLEWLRKNVRLLAACAAGLLALSVLIGLLIGRAQRGVYGGPRTPRGRRQDMTQSGRSQSGGVKGVPQTGERAGEPNPLILPPPIVPGFEEGVPSYSFILDRADAVLMDMEPVPLKISDLLANRAAEVQPDVKPFTFNNEEFDVLVETNELAEP
jgi:hypothetical protein